MTLIAFEGLDRVGKSTQCALLAAHLRAAGVAVEVFSFPRRGTRVGQLLAEHLGGQGEALPARASHLLFSANRWEHEDDVRKVLDAGAVVILDRYVASGTAYSVAQGLPRAWCIAADHGLPVPARTLLLHADLPEARSGYGNERYETQVFQRRVAREFFSMQTAAWRVVDADGSIHQVHARVLDAVADIV
jgi:dTMP kinase